MQINELHHFNFAGVPVRGMLVRLTQAWQEVQRRRQFAPGGLPEPVRGLIGEMAVAGVLLRAGIKFNGTLTMQAFGDGPVKLAVVEVQPDLAFRVTAKVLGQVPEGARLQEMLNVSGKARCVITLDSKDRPHGQPPLQGIVSMLNERAESLQSVSEVVEHYMDKSEHLDIRLVLAANADVAAGLLIQRLPVEMGDLADVTDEREIANREAYARIAHLAATLSREELVTLDTDTLLHRLFWQESIHRFKPPQGEVAPRFACTCSRERVSAMLKTVGHHEVDALIVEKGRIDVGCDFCGLKYQFGPAEIGEIFIPHPDHPPSSVAFH